MGFLEVSTLVLATMVLVLAGMVGYLYFQQGRVIQTVNQIGGLVATHFAQKEDPDEEEEEEEEDDRVSVEEAPKQEPEVEIVEKEEKTAPPSANHVDTDELQDKTATELRDMLTKRGIPFGKRDAKTVLIQLLKATA